MGAVMGLVVAEYLSNECWLGGHTVRVTARGSQAAVRENRGACWRDIYYEFFSPWGGGGGWWRTEGAGFKTIKSIWYGLPQCFEIFERDIV